MGGPHLRRPAVNPSEALRGHPLLPKTHMEWSSGGDRWHRVDQSQGPGEETPAPSTLTPPAPGPLPAARGPSPPAAPQPLLSPPPRPLFVRPGWGRPAPPEARGPWWPSPSARWRRSRWLAAARPRPKIIRVKGEHSGGHGRLNRVGRQNVSLHFCLEEALKYGGGRKCECV